LGKNIVLCFDGTGQQFGSGNSNVVKLFQTLLHNSDEQLSFYDPGVGTFSVRDPLFKWQDALGRALGLMIGWGLFRNIETMYDFLIDKFQPGDKIFILGFSRGAYTARAFAGMIHEVGLLRPDCRNLFENASRIYQIEPTDWDAHRAIVRDFRRQFSRECQIHFLGLWDTVRSIGWFWDPYRLRHTARNPSVSIVRHAVSIDERRCFFRQNLWGAPTDNQDVNEVWFAGVHSDVGGSYPEAESGLSKIALEWMIREASQHGLSLNESEGAAVLGEVEGYVRPDAFADAHESLQRWWWLAELLPRRFMDPNANFRQRWAFPLIHWDQIGRRRYIRDGIKIHKSVQDRMNADRTPRYAPPNLIRATFTVEN